MKGKKFTAAEKHFIKKEEQYQKRIKALEELVIAQENKNISNLILSAYNYSLKNNKNQQSI